MGSPKILLAWELGGNRGHATALGAVAGALLNYGAELVFAVQRLDALRTLRPMERFGGVFQAPVWPGLLVTAGFRSPRPPATFGDILAGQGMHDSAVVEFLLRGWDAIFATVRPDAIVTDFAPMAQLAARGRFPVIATGTGFANPPDHLPEFPPLRDGVPTFPEPELLQVVNRGLERTGRAGLERLPQMLGATRTLVSCFSVFDPYGSTRRTSLLPPVLPGWGPAPGGDGEEIFVYFSETAPGLQRLAEMLPRLGRRVRLYVPNLPASLAERLSRAGVTVERQAVPVAEIARRSRLVVSHGGMGLVSMTLAAGLPQVVLSVDLEKALIGLSVMRLGVGHALAWRTVTSESVAAAVGRVAADAAIRQRARIVGAELAPLLATDSTDEIAQEVLRVAGR